MCMYVFVCVCACVRVSEYCMYCMYVQYVYVYVYVCICVCICICVCMCMCMCICMCMCVRAYVYLYVRHVYVFVFVVIGYVFIASTCRTSLAHLRFSLFSDLSRCRSEYSVGAGSRMYEGLRRCSTCTVVSEVTGCDSTSSASRVSSGAVSACALGISTLCSTRSR